jgi:hypothetical protein
VSRTALGRFGGALVVAASALLGVACGRSPERVATLAVAPAELRLPFPGFERIDVTLTPRAELPPGSEPKLFLHLLDEPGSVLRTFDLVVPGAWEVGRPIAFAATLYQSALADPLDSGTYILTAGLYVREGDRFALATEAREVARLEYAVATVTVPAPEATLPAVRFSSGWLPAVPGQDRQVLVRRVLDGAGPATFQIGPLAPPGRILLRLAPAALAGGRLEIGPGSDSARVRLRSSCGGVEAELAGDVAVETLLDVPPAGGPVECDVELAPNFVVRSPEDGRERSIAVEVLAWRAGAPEGEE